MNNKHNEQIKDQICSGVSPMVLISNQVVHPLLCVSILLALKLEKMNITGHYGFYLREKKNKCRSECGND